MKDTVRERQSQNLIGKRHENVHETRIHIPKAI